MGAPDAGTAPVRAARPATTRKAATTKTALDDAGLKRLLGQFEGTRVTLCMRVHLGDEIVRLVRDWICSAAERELDLEIRVVPTQEAGAILYVDDIGRVVLDPRTTWISEVERALRDRIETGELTDADDAYSFMRDALEAPMPAASIEPLVDTGTVVRMADGVAAVVGLRDCGSMELVEFEGGSRGLAFLLWNDAVGVVALTAEDGIREGSGVRRTGQKLKVPVGDGMLGRVIDPLGRPIDGLGQCIPAAWRPVEKRAPGIVDRSPVDRPLHTGIKVIDALVPIGRGQRELIIGDRKIGKTTMALDTILAQKGRDVRCIYCAIGQKGSSVSQVVSVLREQGALSYTAIVVALPGDMPAMRYLAPYSACTLGEFFMERGDDVLVVYDDLTKHAMTYREMSALLDRPVGREAYPGDIFYVHSRLLERAAHLSVERKGGSLTALPIVETLSGDISAFIPTNVVSICDGQIVLDTGTFNEGRRPAMDAGLSVSRVGGAAQSRVLRTIAGRLRIDLAQFEEMARFVKFGAEVDESTQRQLRRGERARELLRQQQHHPLLASEEALVLYAVVNGYFDPVDLERVAATEERLLDWANAHRAETMRRLESADGVDDALRAELDELLGEFFARHGEEAVVDPALEGVAS